MLGTVEFMSPEQARGERVTGLSDVYALSATLYYALSARLPFEGDTMTARLLAKASGPPVDLAPEHDQTRHHPTVDVAESGQIVVTERVRPFFAYVGNCLRQTTEGSILLGSSHGDKGYDDGTDVATAAGLCKTALRVFPQLADATIVRMWSSLRVMTPDGLPIYEESSRYPGAFAATCHSGVTLASVHAFDIGPAIAAGVLPADVSTFRSDRFNVQSH